MVRSTHTSRKQHAFDALGCVSTRATEHATATLTWSTRRRVGKRAGVTRGALERLDTHLRWFIALPPSRGFSRSWVLHHNHPPPPSPPPQAMLDVDGSETLTYVELMQSIKEHVAAQNL
eukprot:8446395-Pyramimonas_sp.AAC.1